jgi:hypothetical protein
MATANPAAKDLAKRLSTRLANYKLTDATITRLTERVLIDGMVMHRWSPCALGICIDYFSDKTPDLDMFRKRGISRFEVFPYGIIDWDRWHVRVGFEVDELQGKVINHAQHAAGY